MYIYIYIHIYIYKIDIYIYIYVCIHEALVISTSTWKDTNKRANNKHITHIIRTAKRSNTSTDKDANTYALICKKLYTNRLLAEA